MVKQVIEFIYMGVDITSSENRVKGIKTQTQMAARVAGFLNYLIWGSQYMRKEIN